MSPFAFRQHRFRNLFDFQIRELLRLAAKRAAAIQQRAVRSQLLLHQVFAGEDALLHFIDDDAHAVEDHVLRFAQGVGF